MTEDEFMILEELVSEQPIGNIRLFLGMKIDELVPPDDVGDITIVIEDRKIRKKPKLSDFDKEEKTKNALF